MNQTIFDETIDQATYIYGAQLVYNDSEYSKLALGHTMWQIRERASALRNETLGLPAPATPPQGSTKTDLGPFKFALYAAHDTTIMPILQILGAWDGVWPPYASMINFEFYRDTVTQDYYFRLVYQGQVLTDQVHNNDVACPAGEELCSIDIFNQVCLILFVSVCLFDSCVLVWHV